MQFTIPAEHVRWTRVTAEGVETSDQSGTEMAVVLVPRDLVLSECSDHGWQPG